MLNMKTKIIILIALLLTGCAKDPKYICINNELYQVEPQNNIAVKIDSVGEFYGKCQNLNNENKS